MKRKLRIFAGLTVLVFAATSLVAAPAIAKKKKKDKQPPQVWFTTEENATVSQATPVTGEVVDKKSPIKKVRVIFCNGSKSDDGSWVCNGIPEGKDAELNCDSTGKHCTWSATPPLTPGSKLVFVEAKDTKKNSDSEGPLQVYVI